MRTRLVQKVVRTVLVQKVIRTVLVQKFVPSTVLVQSDVFKSAKIQRSCLAVQRCCYACRRDAE